MCNEKIAGVHRVIAAGRQWADDKTASIAPELFSRLKKDGSPENNPDNAPALWKDVLYRSVVDANVSTPAQDPDHWERIP